MLARPDVEVTCGFGLLSLAADPTSSGQLGKNIQGEAGAGSCMSREIEPGESPAAETVFSDLFYQMRRDETRRGEIGRGRQGPLLPLSPSSGGLLQ